MTIEQVTAGITREWVGDICVYTITSLAINSLSSWNESIIALLNSIQNGQNRLMLCYDLSAGGVSMPYMIYNNYKIDNIAVMPSYRPVVEKTIANHPDLVIGLALVIADTMTGKITLSRGRQSIGSGSQVYFNTFFDREAAIDWLSNLDPAQEK